MILVDLTVYAALVAVLLLRTRTRPNQVIRISYRGVSLPGPVLKCHDGLNTRIGLLNTPQLSVGSGILLSGVRSIHTRGMVFPIDIVFVDDTLRVLDFRKAVPPGEARIKGPRGTKSVFEFGAGSIDLFLADLKPYGQLEVQA